MSISNEDHTASDVLGEVDLQTLAGSVKPHALAPERKRALRERLFERLDAPAPEGTVTVRAEQAAWQELLPLVEVKVLHRSEHDNSQTVLWRLHPGAVVPGHGHAQQEECLVLEGEVRVGDHVIRQGDMHIAAPGCEHGDFISDAGAVLLVRSELQPLSANDLI